MLALKSLALEFDNGKLELDSGTELHTALTKGPSTNQVHRSLISAVCFDMVVL